MSDKSEIEMLKIEVVNLKNLLREVCPALKSAVGAELDYGDYSAAVKFRDLKVKIEKIVEGISLEKN
ncbi:hypothetical protein EBZ80_17105 [bacterium]|nr:hypothetical protein [bacterium]